MIRIQIKLCEILYSFLSGKMSSLIVKYKYTQTKLARGSFYFLFLFLFSIFAGV